MSLDDREFTLDWPLSDLLALRDALCARMLANRPVNFRGVHGLCVRLELSSPSVHPTRLTFAIRPCSVSA